jgi:4-amino-4-deoxy-L-arabinose transferase-like glycosyltransferase
VNETALATKSGVDIERRNELIRSFAKWLLVGGTLVTGAVCYGFFYRRGLGLSLIGYSLSPSERVLRGEIPYRDFLFNYTPGVLWINALLMKWFGATLMASRIGLLGFKLATLIALLLVTARLTSAWTAPIPALLMLAWIGYGQIINVYPDQYLILFALISLLLMLRYNETGSNLLLILCGATAGLVFLFKHNVGVYVFVAGIAAIAAREAASKNENWHRLGLRRLSLRLGSYSGGFAVVAGALVTYLIYNHALGPMIAHFVSHAAEYSETRSVGLRSPVLIIPVAILALPTLAVALGILFLGKERHRFAFLVYCAYLSVIAVGGSLWLLHSTRGKTFNDCVLTTVAYFPPVIFLFGAATAIWQLREVNWRAGGWWERNGATAITGLFALAVYLELYPRADFFHLVRVLPLVFVFFVAMLFRAMPALTGLLRRVALSPGLAGACLVAVPLIWLAVAGVHNCWGPELDQRYRFRDIRELMIDRGRGILVEEGQARLAEGLVNLIHDNSSPDDSIFSFAQRGSALYFLAGRRNPSRLLWWSSVGINASERDAVMKMVSEGEPKLIIVQDIAANEGLIETMSETYSRLGRVEDIAVFERKN